MFQGIAVGTDSSLRSHIWVIVHLSQKPDLRHIPASMSSMGFDDEDGDMDFMMQDEFGHDPVEEMQPPDECTEDFEMAELTASEPRSRSPILPVVEDSRHHEETPAKSEVGPEVASNSASRSSKDGVPRPPKRLRMQKKTAASEFFSELTAKSSQSILVTVSETHTVMLSPPCTLLTRLATQVKLQETHMTENELKQWTWCKTREVFRCKLRNYYTKHAAAVMEAEACPASVAELTACKSDWKDKRASYAALDLEVNKLLSEAWCMCTDAPDHIRGIFVLMFNGERSATTRRCLALTTLFTFIGPWQVNVETELTAISKGADMDDVRRELRTLPKVVSLWKDFQLYVSKLKKQLHATDYAFLHGGVS